MISEVQFALKDEGAKFPGVGTIKWIGFPKLRLPLTGSNSALNSALEKPAKQYLRWGKIDTISMTSEYTRMTLAHPSNEVNLLCDDQVLGAVTITRSQFPFVSFFSSLLTHSLQPSETFPSSGYCELP